MREDHKAQRALYEKVGLAELMDWQRCPLIDVRGNRPNYEEVVKVPTAGCFDRMVFERGIYWSHSDPGNVHGGRPHEIFYMIKKAPEADYNDVPLEDPYWVVLVVFSQGKSIIVPNIVDNATGCGTTLTKYLPENHSSENLQMGVKQEMHAVAHDMKYLAELAAHPVSITPPPPRNPKRHKKTMKTKPWLREDLSSVIMMDPTKARSYGHRADTTGTHNSPIPHHRRGHYMTLRAARYGENRGKRIWIRPAWIGDMEWVHNGSTYRVVQTEQ